MDNFILSQIVEINALATKLMNLEERMKTKPYEEIPDKDILLRAVLNSLLNSRVHTLEVFQRIEHEVNFKRDSKRFNMIDFGKLYDEIAEQFSL